MSKSNQERYVARIELYVYADSDKQAIKKANKIASKINKKTDREADVIAVIKRPFGTFFSESDIVM